MFYFLLYFLTFEITNLMRIFMNYNMSYVIQLLISELSKCDYITLFIIKMCIYRLVRRLWGISLPFGFILQTMLENVFQCRLACFSRQIEPGEVLIPQRESRIRYSRNPTAIDRTLNKTMMSTPQSLLDTALTLLSVKTFIDI